MKRVYAYMIDYCIMMLILMIEVVIVPILLPAIERNSRFIMAYITIFLYCFLSDMIFKGSSLGKKTAGMTICIKGNILKFSLLHSMFKMLFSFIWPISIIILLCSRGKMPYDFLYKTIY